MKAGTSSSLVYLRHEWKNSVCSLTRGSPCSNSNRKTVKRNMVLDTEQMKQPMQPWEFRAKPAWQRLLIMIGGVLFNFLLALFIYSMILFAWGDEYVPLQKAPLGMDFNETAKAIGFRDGDILVSADGVPFERYGGDMLTSIVDARQVSVLRNGQEVSVYIPEDMMERLLADSVRFASFRYPFVIDSIMPGQPAALAGLQPGDSITQLDGRNIAYFDFKEEMPKSSQRQYQPSSHPDLRQSGGSGYRKADYRFFISNRCRCIPADKQAVARCQERI